MLDVLEFYNNLPRLELPGSPYIKALGYTNDYRVFNIEKDYKLFEQLGILNKDVERGDKLKKYLLKFNENYIWIPLKDFDQTIFGFVIRTVVGKNFHNFSINRNFPQMFGLYDFGDYELGKPILLTEGIKDALTLKQIYKYSLGYLTSVPSDNLMRWLVQISNKIIFYPDDDQTGRNLKFTPSYYCPYGKDIGTFWDNGDVRILDWIKITLRKEKVIDLL